MGEAKPFLRETPGGNCLLDVRPSADGGTTYVCQPGQYAAKGPTMDFNCSRGSKPFTDADIDRLIAERLAFDAVAAKHTVIDAALNAELEKRKVAVDYERTGADAVATVFPVAVKP